jgi:flagellar hook-associated protein 2
MSFTSGTSAASNTPQGTLGDVPPVTFPGIASGIDYNAIIQKYTQATQAAEVPYQNQINNLNKANAEILRIQNLLNSVQDTLTAISNVQTFQAYVATPSTSGVATTSQIKGQNAVPGTYSIQSQTAATSTQIVNDSAANATLTPAAESATALSSIGASVTPTNGTLPNGQPATNGTLTINGVQISWNTSESVQAILNSINSAGAGVQASYNPNGTVTLASTTASSFAIGGASDVGNLIQVLHLDTAQDVTPAAGTLVGAVASGSNTITVSSAANYAVGETLTLDAGQPTQENVTIQSIAGNVITLTANTTQNHANGSTVNPLEYATSSSPIVGINQFATLGATGNAGFATAVTSGTFTINGVQITINAATQSVSNVISLINQSAAGVTASFNSNTDHIVLTNNTPGNQNILLGSGSDTSNFLGVSGLSNATGLNPTKTTGTQASLTYLGPTGAPVTVFSSTNDFTSVIPGIDLKVTSSTATPYTVSVANDPTTAEKAIGTFVTAYNLALDELNAATQPPQITTSINTSTGSQQSQQATGGGVLYKNFEVVNLRNQLVQIVSGLIPSGSTSYNSLQSIGLKLDTAAVSAGTTDSSDATNKTDDSSLQNLTSTSGRLQALDVTTFAAALAANPTAVQTLFTSTTGGLAQSLGSQLTLATGLPTFLAHGIADSVPTQSLLNTVEDSNQLQIDALTQQVNLINSEAVMQANELRAQFSASETQIAQLQALQSQIASIGH